MALIVAGVIAGLLALAVYFARSAARAQAEGNVHEERSEFMEKLANRRRARDLDDLRRRLARRNASRRVL